MTHRSDGTDGIDVRMVTMANRHEFKPNEWRVLWTDFWTGDALVERKR